MTREEAKIGVRVRLKFPTRSVDGVVEFVDGESVRVEWSDGNVGILYFDTRCMAQAGRLEVLRDAA